MVSFARDINSDDLPDQMYLNGIPLANENLSEEFAKMFEEKIDDIAKTTSINNEVYNGSRKITENESMNSFKIKCKKLFLQ